MGSLPLDISTHGPQRFQFQINIQKRCFKIWTMDPRNRSAVRLKLLLPVPPPLLLLFNSVSCSIAHVPFVPHTH
jgi:hypothetical protein